jgi:nucleotide-binding universal stress UspA family protein
MASTRRRSRNILVPTDFSEPAREAWRYAQTLARETPGRIHLLHVVPQPYVYDAWGTERAAIHSGELLAEAEGAASTLLGKLVPRSGPLRGRVLTSTASGLIVDRILEYVSKHRIDLIVMGTHGRGLVGHVLLGSVAERVVQRSSVPVLTVHGKSPARQSKRRRAK